MNETTAETRGRSCSAYSRENTAYTRGPAVVTNAYALSRQNRTCIHTLLLLFLCAAERCPLWYRYSNRPWPSCQAKRASNRLLTRRGIPAANSADRRDGPRFCRPIQRLTLSCLADRHISASAQLMPVLSRAVHARLRRQKRGAIRVSGSLHISVLVRSKCGYCSASVGYRS